MENIKKYLNFIFIAAFLYSVSGCSADYSDNTGFTPKSPDLTIVSDAEVNISDDAQEMAVTVKANLPWRVKSDAGWITFKESNGMGDGELAMLIQANELLESREGVVTAWITDDCKQSFKIIQAATIPGKNPKDYYVKTTGNDSSDGLSWAKAVTLQGALDKARLGDRIHIAAGTYSPSQTLTGGNSDNVGDCTFEIKSNITLKGGYPADAMEGAEADPVANKTTLSGTMSGGTAYHVMVISAPITSGWRVKIQDITVSNGQAAASGTGSVTVNGAMVYRFYGGGVVVAGSGVDFENCSIINNKSGLHAGGVFVTGGSVATFDNCQISENTCLTTGSNCAGLYNEASTVTINNCVFNGNLTTGVAGALYAFHGTQPTYTYVYNTTFSGNNINMAGTHKNRRGGAFYARENSQTVFVNCTFSGNIGGYGGAISAYGGAGKTSKVDVISCTITGNNAETSGGGIEVNGVNTTVTLYNTIVSGNTSADAKKDECYTGASTQRAKMYNCVITETTTDAEGNPATDAAAFNPETMLGPLAHNGGKTQTIALTGSGNPALTFGMNSTNLSALGLNFIPAIPDNIITFDQRGKTRKGKTVIGAWAE